MKLTNYQILRILIRAKRTYKYKDGIGFGMCAHIAKAFYYLYDKNIYYSHIVAFIPEFNYKDLNGRGIEYGYW